jgi:hypothetical protein
VSVEDASDEGEAEGVCVCVEDASDEGGVKRENVSVSGMRLMRAR